MKNEHEAPSLDHRDGDFLYLSEDWATDSAATVGEAADQLVQDLVGFPTMDEILKVDFVRLGLPFAGQDGPMSYLRSLLPPKEGGGYYGDLPPQEANAVVVVHRNLERDETWFSALLRRSQFDPWIRLVFAQEVSPRAPLSALGTAHLMLREARWR